MPVVATDAVKFHWYFLDFLKNINDLVYVQNTSYTHEVVISSPRPDPKLRIDQFVTRKLYKT